MSAVRRTDYAPFADRLGTHAKGELLGGLASAYRLSGDDAKATAYLTRISKELPGTAYDLKAQKWLADLRAVPREDHFCIGCHTQ